MRFIFTLLLCLFPCFGMDTQSQSDEYAPLVPSKFSIEMISFSISETNWGIFPKETWKIIIYTLGTQHYEPLLSTSKNLYMMLRDIYQVDLVPQIRCNFNSLYKEPKTIFSDKMAQRVANFVKLTYQINDLAHNAPREQVRKDAEKLFD